MQQECSKLTQKSNRLAECNKGSKMCILLYSGQEAEQKTDFQQKKKIEKTYQISQLNNFAHHYCQRSVQDVTENTLQDVQQSL